MKLVRIVTHPVMAHGVDGRGQSEPGKVHFAVKQRHHMWNVPARVAKRQSQLVNISTLAPWDAITLSWLKVSSFYRWFCMWHHWHATPTN